MWEQFRKLFPPSEIDEEDFQKYKEARGLYIEDPWERVKTIFQVDEFHNYNPELLRAINVAQIGFIIGGIMGAISESAKQSKEFIRTNDTNVYINRREMYKVMSNRAILAMGTGGFRLGPKVGLFVGGFSLVTSCVEAYRNKSGIFEYVIGGFVAGGVTKLGLGIKGFIAGSTFGALLGLFNGTVHVIAEKLSKSDALILKYSHYAYLKHKKSLFQKMNSTSEVTPTDKLVTGLHGEHVENPLDKFD